jgi:hypothetical protein
MKNKMKLETWKHINCGKNWLSEKRNAEVETSIHSHKCEWMDV